MKNRLITLLSIATIGSAGVIMAQDYDDIYYDSSKENKKEKSENIVEKYNQNYKNEDYASKYIVEERDVDEYNRRGDYVGDETASNDAVADSSKIGDDSFVYTDRIKRFHNPTVIVESGDEDLVDLYVYTRPSVNVVVGTPSYYSPWSTLSVGYYDPWSWGYNSWSWSPWYYDSFYYSSWYRPYWYSSWYAPVPHWGWGCGPYYHHHHYGYGGWYNGPVHRPNGYRGGGNVGSRRPVGPGRYNGSGVRVGNNGDRIANRGNRIGNIVNRRPGVNTTTSVNRNDRESYTGSGRRGGNVRFGSGDIRSGGNSRGNGVYRRSNPRIGNSGSSSYENNRVSRRPSYDSERRSSNSNYNSDNNRSSFSPSRSSSFSSGSRGGGFSTGGGRASGSSNGARGGGHRR